MDLKALILAALKKQGLSEDLASQIKVDSEDQIEGAVKALKEKQARKSLSDFLKENGYEEDFQRMLQSETDRRVTQALQTFEKKIAEKKNDNGTPSTEGIVNPEVKTLSEQIQNLNNLMNGIIQKNKQQTLRESFLSRLKEKGIPEVYANHVNIDSEDKIDEVVSALENGYKAMKQSIIDEAIKSGHVPPRGSDTPSITEAVIEDYAKTKIAASNVKVQPIE